MVGCGLLMLCLAWYGSYLSVKERIGETVGCCGRSFSAFRLPWIAILTGWFTAEVGRQPWTVYGVLRTADAVTPFLTAREATISLVRVLHGLQLHLRVRPPLHLPAAACRTRGRLIEPPVGAVPNRPMSVVASPRDLAPSRRENEHDHVLGGGARH